MTFNNIKLDSRALHTGEVVGSIPTAPTMRFNGLASAGRVRAQVYVGRISRATSQPIYRFISRPTRH